MRPASAGPLAAALVLGAVLGALAGPPSVRGAPEPAASDADTSSILEAFEELERARLEAALCLDQWSPRELLDALGSSEACEATIEEGDTTFGTVHVIGQIHESPDAPSTIASEALAVYQSAIFRHLLRNDARVLFVEGWPADSELVRRAPETEALLRETVRHLPAPESLLVRGTERQVALLQTSLAMHAAFRALRPGVRVMGADTTLQFPPHDPFAQESLAFEVRERVAMRAVTRYLSGHPGSRVFVVYGAAHLFDRESLPPGSRVPRITQTTFPALFAAHPAFQARVARRLGRDPALLERYVSLLEGIVPEVFADAPEPVQRACLARPFYLDRDTPDGDALEAWLLEHAKSDAVRQIVKTTELRYFEP